MDFTKVKRPEDQKDKKKEPGAKKRKKKKKKNEEGEEEGACVRVKLVPSVRFRSSLTPVPALLCSARVGGQMTMLRRTAEAAAMTRVVTVTATIARRFSVSSLASTLWTHGTTHHSPQSMKVTTSCGSASLRYGSFGPRRVGSDTMLATSSVTLLVMRSIERETSRCLKSMAANRSSGVNTSAILPNYSSITRPSSTTSMSSFSVRTTDTVICFSVCL